ncbi:MAG: hypothetical protein PHT15_04410 [Gallionellaceae bacterium]|nr:hypothetical protein [Gallionellaceae bacterium]
MARTLHNPPQAKDLLDKMLLEESETVTKLIRIIAVPLPRRLRMADVKLVDRQFNGQY